MLFKNFISGMGLSITAVFALLTISCLEEESKLFPTNVTVSTVTSKNVNPSAEFVGQALAKEKVSLMARVPGFLVKKNFDNGSYVKKGDIVFIIEKNQYVADVEAAKAAVFSAEADYQNAIIEFNRLSKLKITNAVSQREYDKSVQIKNSTEGALLLAKAKLKVAELNLSYTEVIAPCDGKLGAANYDVGNLVGPSGRSLTTLTMMDPIEIEFAISESFLVSAAQSIAEEKVMKNPNAEEKLNMRKITPRLVLSNGSEYPYVGEIYFVDNKINPLTGTVNLRASFPNPSHIIIPGSYVRVRLYKNVAQRSTLVPLKAVQEEQSGKFVFVVNKDKKVELRNIHTTQEHEAYYIVSEGVKEGEVIIVEGLQKVRAGMTVNPFPESDSKTMNIAQKK